MRVGIVAAVIAGVLLSVGPRPPVAHAATAPPTNQGGWVAGFGTNGVGRIHNVVDVPRTAASDGRGGVYAAIAAYGADPFLLHMTPTGTADNNYGNKGRAALSGFQYVSALVRVGTGLVVIGSDTKPWDAPGALRVTRLAANGLPDPTFHGGVPIALAADRVNPLNAVGALLSDGRLAVAVAEHVVIVTSAGVLDVTAGDGGIVDTAIPGRPAIAARGNGYLVAGQILRDADGNGGEGLWTIPVLAQSSPGVNDATFGDHGRTDIVDDRVQNEGVEGILLSSDGVVVGTNGAMFRLTPAGQRDAAFAADAPGVFELGMQDDGKIVGQTATAIERFTANGRPDPTFGVAGRVSGYLNRWQGRDNNWYPQTLLVTGKLIQMVGQSPDLEIGTNEPDLTVATRSGARSGGAPVMNILDGRVFERPVDRYQDQVMVRFDRVPEEPMDITFAFVDKSAQGVTDFGFSRATVQYGGGGDPQTFLLGIEPRNDAIPEPLEQIGVRLVSAGFALVGTHSTANVLVVDDTGPKPLPPVVAATSNPYGTFRGGAFVAAGDLDGDGRAEVVTGADAGGGPRVRVLRFNATTRALDTLADFFAYDPSFTGGVRVATADVDGDGRAELITAPGVGGGPHVRVWGVEGSRVTEVAGFMAGDANATAGVFVAGGDIDNDRRDEVVTVFGPGGPTDVAGYRVESGGATRTYLNESEYPTLTRSGSSVAVGRLNAYREFGNVVVAPLSGTRPVRSTNGLPFSFSPYGGDTHGVMLAAGNVGTAGGELLTTPASGTVPLVTVWSALWGKPRKVYSFNTYEQSFRGGVRLAVGDLDGDGSGEVVTAPGPGRLTAIAVRAIPLH